MQQVLKDNHTFANLALRISFPFITSQGPGHFRADTGQPTAMRSSWLYKTVAVESLDHLLKSKPEAVEGVKAN